MAEVSVETKSADVPKSPVAEADVPKSEVRDFPAEPIPADLPAVPAEPPAPAADAPTVAAVPAVGSVAAGAPEPPPPLPSPPEAAAAASPAGSPCLTDAGAASGAGTSGHGAGSVRWLERVAEVQLARLTPEQRQAVRTRADHAQRTRQYTSRYTSLTHTTCGLTPMLTAAFTDYSRTAGVYRLEAAEGHSADVLRTCVTTTDFAAAPPPVVDEAAVAAEVGGAVAAAEGGERQQREEVLRAVRTEPPDDEGRAAAFRIYEGFAEAVATVRGRTLDEWVAAREQFPPQPRAVLDTRVAALDKREACGVDDSFFDVPAAGEPPAQGRPAAVGGGEREWFVVGMVRQVSRNMATLRELQADVARRLALLAAQEHSEDPCPVCLTPFAEIAAAGGACETLPCCHRVCAPCWREWRAVVGELGGLFCPLCRHAAFIATIAPYARAPARHPERAREPEAAA